MASYSGPVSAAIYQCQDTDGRKVFSDQPCGGSVNKALPEYQVKLEPYVSGRFTMGNTSFPVRQGIAIWNREEQSLQVILTMNPLSATEKQQALTDDWSFLNNHSGTGVVTIDLLLETSDLSVNAVKTMTLEIHHSRGADAPPLRATLGGDDIIGHITRLQATEKEGTTWLEFNTQEFKPELRWSISLILPLAG
ncbi:MAG: DUF4124 domain-containing protein [Ketobacteraceae bacterium]|nr:DUF4124 domain-containing protein [Ketobacteraceae bacterium]